MTRSNILWLIKRSLLIVIAVIFIYFPNPILLTKQIFHYFNIEKLVRYDFPGITGINKEIDSLMPTNCVPTNEFKIIEGYVNKNIKYQYDWDNWLNADYWPPAKDVWERKREDCDGRAILTVAILRSRGYKSAQIVGNIEHIWVDVDNTEIMGPKKEKTIVTRNEKLDFKLPSKNIILHHCSFYLPRLPIRNLLLLYCLIIILSFPLKDYKTLFVKLTIGLTGYVLLLSWSLHYDGEINTLLLSAILLIALSTIFSFLIDKYFKSSNQIITSHTEAAELTEKRNN